jgi:hypothetical protein
MNKSQTPISKSQINPKLQTPISNFSKLKKLVIGYWLLFGIWNLMFGVSLLFAQENLEVLKDQYFKDNKYSEFIDYLKDLNKKSPSAQISYYVALTRSRQLKYLEETQNWNDYFSFGDSYRSQIIEELKNSISPTVLDKLGIYARCLLWQFYKDQDDAQEEGAREDLISSAIKYAAENKDIEPVRFVADTLFGYGNKGHAKKLYNIYVQKLIESETNEDKLKEAAVDAYKKE